MKKRVKILHVVNTYLPESENWLYALFKNLASVNHHIYSTHQINPKYLRKEFIIHASPLGNLREKKWALKGMKPNHFLIWLWISIKLFFYPKSSSYLKRVIKKESPELIHFHFGDVAVEYLNTISKSSIPVAISFYGIDYEYLPKKYPKIYNGYKSLFNKEVTFICEGNYGKKILIENGCPSHKIKVLKLGVDLTRKMIKNNSKEKNSLNLIQVASFTEKKGHIFTVRAIQECIKEYENIKCTFVGDDRDGKTKAILKEYIVSESLEEYFEMIDFISYNKLNELMKNYDVFIHPSCYSKENDCEGGAPIILLEAQAIGLPVISSKHCDIPEEVIHNKTGILCEEKSVSELAEAIKLFYKMERPTYSIFSENAHQHVKENYDIKKNAILFNELYIDLITQDD